MLDRLGVAMQKKNIDNDTPREGFQTQTEIYRRLELQRISIENKELLHRIQTVDPTCNKLEWERDAMKREVILR